MSTFFPSNFPTVNSGFFQVMELYGPPYGGSPPIGMDVKGNRLVWTRDSTHRYDTAWTAATDIHKGTQWENVVFHVKWATDNSGFVEIWLNGAKQTLSNGTTRMNMATMVPSINGTSDTVFVNQYRQAGLGTVTLYHDDIRVGNSYDAVAR